VLGPGAHRQRCDRSVITLPQRKESREIAKWAAPSSTSTKSAPASCPSKAAYLPGHLRAARGRPAMSARPAVPAKVPRAQGHSHRPGLKSVLRKRSRCCSTCSQTRRPRRPTDRAAEDGNLLSGDKLRGAHPARHGQNGYVVVGGFKALDLRANAAIDLSRIAGKEPYDAVQSPAAKEKDAQGIFGEALDRMQVAKDCDKDIDCYPRFSTPIRHGLGREGRVAHPASPATAGKGVPILGSTHSGRGLCSTDRYPVHRRNPAVAHQGWPMPHASCARRSAQTNRARRDKRSVCPARVTFWARPACLGGHPKQEEGELGPRVLLSRSGSRSCTSTDTQQPRLV